MNIALLTANANDAVADKRVYGHLQLAFPALMEPCSRDGEAATRGSGGCTPIGRVVSTPGMQFLPLPA
jgi:hypothetical protein